VICSADKSSPPEDQAVAAHRNALAAADRVKAFDIDSDLRITIRLGRHDGRVSGKLLAKPV